MHFLSFCFEKEIQMSTGKQKWSLETAQSSNFDIKKILKMQELNTLHF